MFLGVTNEISVDRRHRVAAPQFPPIQVLGLRTAESVAIGLEVFSDLCSDRVSICSDRVWPKAVAYRSTTAPGSLGYRPISIRPSERVSESVPPIAPPIASLRPDPVPALAR